MRDQIYFFDRTYKISKDNIELINQKTIWTASEDYEYDLKSLLGYYVLSDANIEPMYEYCTLGYFSSGLSLVLYNKEFVDTFGNDYKKYEDGNRDGKHILFFILFFKPFFCIICYFYQN
jgi:hypothetical protein